MSNPRKICAVAVLVALAWAVAPVAEAQTPIRIGASLAQTGVAALLGQDQLRGYQLCVKHVNEKGGVLGRKVELVGRTPPRASVSNAGQGGSGARAVRLNFRRRRGRRDREA